VGRKDKVGLELSVHFLGAGSDFGGAVEEPLGFGFQAGGVD
jgi:hypothetical protein